MEIGIILTELIFVGLQASIISMSLKPQKHRILSSFAVFLPAFLLRTASVFVNFQNPHITICMYLIMILAVMLAYRDSVINKLFVIISIIICQALPSMLYFTLAKQQGANIYYEDDLAGFIVSHIIIILIDGLFCILWRHHHKLLKIRLIDALVFFALPLSQLIMCMAFQVFNNPNIWHGELSEALSTTIHRSTYFLAFSVLLFITIDIVLYRKLLLTSKLNKEKEELHVRLIKDEMTMEQFKIIEENSLKLKKLRHDLANALEIASDLADGKHEAAKEASANIINGLKNELESTRNEYFTDNVLINTILYTTATRCKENNINYSFSASVPKELSIPELDVCRALTNIINNAINALGTLTDNREFKLDISVIDGYLYIKSKNAAPDSSIEYEDNSEHGYGMYILEDLGKKNDGMLIVDNKDKYYSLMLTMKIQQ